MAKETSTPRFFIINDPFRPQLCPELAEEIGLLESIILLQLEYWITHPGHKRDGYQWTYQSTSGLKDKFPFMSLSTIQRTINSLIDQKLITAATYNKKTFDRTRWFRINPEGYKTLKSLTLVHNERSNSQNERSDSQNEARSGQNEPTIPKTSTKISSEREEAPLSDFQNSDPEPEGVTTLAASPKGASVENNPKSKSETKSAMGDLSGDTSGKNPDHATWEAWRQKLPVGSGDIAQRLGPVWMYLKLCPTGKLKKVTNEILDEITMSGICYHRPHKLNKLRPAEHRGLHACIGL